MGKRSTFERRERDFYPTPKEAVTPLIPFLPDEFFYVEPCAGDFTLCMHLADYDLRCSFACDIEPQNNPEIFFRPHKQDALTLTKEQCVNSSYIITNPPWSRDILHPMIDHFRKLLPTWLLFDADWCHTKQAKSYLPYCSHIVSVGRVKWIPDSKHTGKDNACWYQFHATEQETRFYGR